MDLDKLCFSMQEKTKEIIKVNEDIKVLKRFLNLLLIPFIIVSIVLVFNFFCIYAGYFSYSLTGYGSYARIPGAVDKLLFFMFIICWYLFTTYSNKLKKSINRFNAIRLNIIDNIGKEFCRCNNTCSCRDEYIKYMKIKKDIDLII